ncbi:hypothetical protein AMTRI_Chr03g145320 [Amborella trichopoda]
MWTGRSMGPWTSWMCIVTMVLLVKIMCSVGNHDSSTVPSLGPR